MAPTVESASAELCPRDAGQLDVVLAAMILLHRQGRLGSAVGWLEDSFSWTLRRAREELLAVAEQEAARRLEAERAKARAAEVEARKSAEVEAWRAWMDQGGRDRVAAWSPRVDETLEEGCRVFLCFSSRGIQAGVGETPREARLDASEWHRRILTDPEEAWDVTQRGPGEEAELLLEEMGAEDARRRIVQLVGPEAEVRALAAALRKTVL